MATKPQDDPIDRILTPEPDDPEAGPAVGVGSEATLADFCSLAQAVAADPKRDMSRPSFPTYNAAQVAKKAQKQAVKWAQQVGKDYGIPDDARVRVHVAILPPATPGKSAVFADLFARILTPTGAVGSQTAIREHVQAQHLKVPVPKDWTVPLPAWSTDALRDIVRRAPAPLNTVSVSSGLTLAQLHKRARAVMQGFAPDAEHYRADVVLSSDAVIVNGTPFRVAPNSNSERAYPYLKVNVDKLRKALAARPRRPGATREPSSPKPRATPQSSEIPDDDR